MASVKLGAASAATPPMAPSAGIDGAQAAGPQAPRARRMAALIAGRTSAMSPITA